MGKNVDDHMQHIKQNLQRIKSAGLKLRHEKCNMLQKEAIMGHVVSDKDVKLSPINVMKIVEWPRPKNGKQVR